MDSPKGIPELILNFLDYIKYEKGYSENTLIAYKKDFTEFTEFLSLTKIMDIHQINYRILHQYVVRISAQSLKPSTIERKVASIKSLFHYLIKNEIIKKNPAQIISSPKKEKLLPNILEKSEILELINSIQTDNAFSVRNKTMILLLYASGLRVSELTNLDISSIDFREGIVTTIGKGNKQRMVPIGETAKQALIGYLSFRKELLANNPQSKALFLTKSGKRIQDRMIRYIINHYITDISIQKHISPHTLRHTFATHLLQNGAGIRIIQELLGHASLSTTQRYTHLTIDKLKESYDQFHPHAD